jgi:hypothetical protein
VRQVEEQLATVLQQAAPESDGVAFEEVARRVHRRRTVKWSALATVGTAAAVGAVVLAVALGSLAPHRPTHQPAGTPSVDLSGTVPWIDTPAQPYKPPPAPSTTQPKTDGRPCSADDVTATWAIGDGAGGRLFTSVRFRNTSQTTCVLKGYPQVVASEPGMPDVTANPASWPSPGTANMPPRQVTFLWLETDTYCDARPDGGGGEPPYHHISIDMPGGGTITMETPARGLDITCGLYRTEFFVEQEPQPEPRDPLADLVASIEVPPTVTAGSVMTYVVELSNPTDQAISLKRCPSYLEVIGSSPAQSKESYALNCAGAAAIQAHNSVQFEMRIHVPTQAPAGPSEVHWSLAGPRLAEAKADVTIA